MCVALGATVCVTKDVTMLVSQYVLRGVGGAARRTQRPSSPQEALID